MTKKEKEEVEQEYRNLKKQGVEVNLKEMLDYYENHDYNSKYLDI